MWPLITVPVEEVEAVEVTEDAEFVRCKAFRGVKTPLDSSEFIACRDELPFNPHAGRLMLAKLGGLATAVMGKGR